MVRRRVVEVESAGGVAYRFRDGGIDVVVCGLHDPRVWMLPKGTPQQGESIEEAATREVQEETGLLVQVVEPLGYIEYWFARGPVRYHKRVHHFLMEPLGGDISRHDAEFDDVRWVTAEQAEQMLTYPNEAAILRRAIERARVRQGSA